MGFFAAAQFHLNAHLVAVGKELFNLARAHLKVVFAGGKADAHPLELHIFLLFAVLALAFFFLVLELAEVHDLADRGLGSGRYLNKVKPAFMRDTQRLGSFKYAEISALFVNNAYGGRADILIYAITLLDSRIIDYL